MSAGFSSQVLAGGRVILAALALWAGAARGVARDTWLKVAGPEVTVITSLGARDAVRWAMEFEQYTTALKSYLGEGEGGRPALTIVVFAQEREFQRYLPLLTPGGRPQPVGGFFTRRESWAVVGMPARVSADTRRTIFHEGVHWFLSTGKTRNPLWLEEGLAEVFSTFHAGDKEAEWGRAVENHVRLLRSAPLLPLERLLGTTQSEVFGNDRTRTGIFYAQSWAFVHLLLFGQHDIPRTAMSSYVETVAHGTGIAEAFRRSFGRTPAEMDRQLRSYLGDGDYHLARLPLAGGTRLRAQAATALEVENALGCLAIVGQRPAQAMTHAGAALAAAPRDPHGHELLALALKSSGDEAGALVEFESAVALGSKDFQAHFETALAAHRALREAQRPPTPGEVRRVADRYLKAIGLYARHPASYENLARLIGLAEPLAEGDRKALERGRRLFPENAVIELGLAQLSRRTGDLAGARAIIERLLASSPGLSPENAEFARRLLAELAGRTGAVEAGKR